MKPATGGGRMCSTLSLEIMGGTFARGRGMKDTLPFEVTFHRGNCVSAFGDVVHHEFDEGMRGHPLVSMNSKLVPTCELI